MAKKTEEFEVSESAVIAPRVKTLISINTSKVYSFEQWARIRNRPERHLQGIRAFLGAEAGSKFSLENWDSKIQNY